MSFGGDSVTVDVALRRRRLHCPKCGFTTRARYDTRPVSSSWRHTDMGRWKVAVRASLSRLACPTHGVRTGELQAVSMDMGAAFNKSVRDNAPRATACIDPFHAVKIVTDALDVVRRQTWNELRKLPDQNAAKKFKGARWSLLKRPEKLTDDQAATLRQLRRRGGDLWRAYSLKEAFREIFSGDLDPDQTAELIDRWCSKAAGRGWRRSSKSPRPSANSATGSSPPSA